MSFLFSKTMKGQHSEFIAAAWLIKQNYLVYIKTQDNDPIDLIAVHRDNGEVQKFDVKSVSIRKTGRVGDRINRVLNEHQKKIGVKLLYVYDDGRCDFHGKD
jgi:Holliday junction resolvase-like predicted endonuclease